jgi:uncharacterized protein YcfL
MSASLRLIFVALLALGVLVPLSGCQTAPPMPEERITTLGEFFAPPSDKVLSTADNILVKAVRTGFTKGHMRVDFKVFNNRGKRNVFNYRVQWLDKDGLMASPYDAWQTSALEGQQEFVLSVNSPTAKATDYRLELQTN